MKLRFKIDGDSNIVCYEQTARGCFPTPHKEFKLEIDGQKYTTSIRNLKSGCTSLAKTVDATGQRITRATLCLRHGLRRGQEVYIEAVTPLQLYRLNKSANAESKPLREGTQAKEPTGQKPTVHTSLTLQQFVSQLGHWYGRYIQSPHFARYKNIEVGLRQKASDVGYLEPGDLLEIAIWGGDEERHQLGTLICRNNTYDNVKTHTGEAIQELNNPSRALKSLFRINYVGPSYGSKILRCICPEKHAAFDYHVRKACKKMLPEMSDRETEVIGYVGFLDICHRLHALVSDPAPRPEGSWYIADIEMAMFQFALEGGTLL